MSQVKIHYGNAELMVTPKVPTVAPKGKLVFKLRPKTRNNDPAGVNYNAVKVTVVGKTANDRVPGILDVPGISMVVIRLLTIRQPV